MEAECTPNHWQKLTSLYGRLKSDLETRRQILHALTPSTFFSVGLQCDGLIDHQSSCPFRPQSTNRSQCLASDRVIVNCLQTRHLTLALKCTAGKTEITSSHTARRHFCGVDTRRPLNTQSSRPVLNVAKKQQHGLYIYKNTRDDFVENSAICQKCKFNLKTINTSLRHENTIQRWTQNTRCSGRYTALKTIQRDNERLGLTGEFQNVVLGHKRPHLAGN